MRILIIDDDVDLRNLLERYITQQWPESQVDQYDPLDHDIPGASFALGSYDVVILDYMLGRGDGLQWLQEFKDRKSTRLNSSHRCISYAVFCLKKKTIK